MPVRFATWKNMIQFKLLALFPVPLTLNIHFVPTHIPMDWRFFLQNTIQKQKNGNYFPDITTKALQQIVPVLCVKCTFTVPSYCLEIVSLTWLEWQASRRDGFVKQNGLPYKRTGRTSALLFSLHYYSFRDWNVTWIIFRCSGMISISLELYSGPSAGRTTRYCLHSAFCMTMDTFSFT